MHNTDIQQTPRMPCPPVKLKKYCNRLLVVVGGSEKFRVQYGKNFKLNIVVNNFNNTDKIRVIGILSILTKNNECIIFAHTYSNTVSE